MAAPAPKDQEPDEEDEREEYEEAAGADIRAILKVPNPLVDAWTIKPEDIQAQREIEKIPHDEPSGVKFASEEEREAPTAGKKITEQNTIQKKQDKSSFKPSSLFKHRAGVLPYRRTFNPYH